MGQEDSGTGVIQASFNLVNEVCKFTGLQKKNIEDVKTTVEKETIKMIPGPGIGSRLFLRLGGLSGAVAVSMAAYGAHGFKEDTPENIQLKKVFDSGNRLHLVHSVALVCTPLCKRPILTGGLMTLGIVLFSGSCYVHALTKNNKIRFVTPYGGFLLIFAWLSMLL